MSNDVHERSMRVMDCMTQWFAGRDYMTNEELFEHFSTCLFEELERDTNE